MKILMYSNLNFEIFLFSNTLSVGININNPIVNNIANANRKGDMFFINFIGVFYRVHGFLLVLSLF